MNQFFSKVAHLTGLATSVYASLFLIDNIVEFLMHHGQTVTFQTLTGVKMSLISNDSGFQGNFSLTLIVLVLYLIFLGLWLLAYFRFFYGKDTPDIFDFLAFFK